MLATIIAAAAAFAATNIDDIIINTLFFAKTQNRRDVLRVVFGKYIGIAALTGASVLCAFILKAVPQTVIGLFGIVPIVYGAREWLIYSKNAGDNSSGSKTDAKNTYAVSVLSVAAVTVANGADNLGVYIPLFAACTMTEMVLNIAVFAVLTAVWCVLSLRISRLPLLQNYLENHRHMIPAIFIFLGVYIIFKGFGL